MIYGMFIHALECDQVKNVQRWFVGIILFLHILSLISLQIKAAFGVGKKIINISMLSL